MEIFLNTLIILATTTIYIIGILFLAYKFLFSKRTKSNRHELVLNTSQQAFMLEKLQELNKKKKTKLNNLSYKLTDFGILKQVSPDSDMYSKIPLEEFMIDCSENKPTKEKELNNIEKIIRDINIAKLNNIFYKKKDK